jgi:glutathione synthase/RimK-type ligase-like ATP-grasp enzyme
MYHLFKEYCPLTFLANSREELLSNLAQVQTELVVVKPVDGEEGRGVYIDSPEKIKELALEYPLLVQEFIDSSVGIEGIVEGLHDLRVALINGEPFYSYYRTPPQGSYLANVARGGSFAMIEPARLPKSILEAVKEIDQKLAEVGDRFYGIDFAMTKTGPKIIEMNSRLGLLPNRDNDIFKALKNTLAEIFLRY